MHCSLEMEKVMKEAECKTFPATMSPCQYILSVFGVCYHPGNTKTFMDMKDIIIPLCPSPNSHLFGSLIHSSHCKLNSAENFKKTNLLPSSTIYIHFSLLY